MIAALLLALQGIVAPPPEPVTPDIVVNGRRYGACGPRYALLYVAPMGEPVRTNGNSDPMAKWLAQADADHDGRVTAAEMAADAQRFFATIDTDRDGELDPQEVSAYEIDVAPEIRLHQADQFDFRRPRGHKAERQARAAARDRADYAAAYGAGTYASLNIPEPVASADLDIDRGISRDEVARVAATRFALLDRGGQGYLAIATLQKSPAQEAIDACYAKEPGRRR